MKRMKILMISAMIGIGIMGMFASLSFASSKKLVKVVNIVAAENFYADVAQQLGQPYVHVTAILNNPEQDPHMFNASPKIAVWIEQADIIIENGLGYDAWMDHLYAASHQKAVLINVSNIIGFSQVISLTNPHIWYEPTVMPMMAETLVQQLIALDPAHKMIYQKNLAHFLIKAKAYQDAVKRVKTHVEGMKVTATEPLVGYLAAALNLNMCNQAFQQDIMNGADLTPREMMDFEESLHHGVQLLIYNAQVTDPTTTALKQLALRQHIPVVGATEMMPVNQHYYTWMQTTLNTIAHALGDNHD